MEIDIDVKEGDKVQRAEVSERYCFSGIETAVLEKPPHGNERQVVREMAQMGWTHHFTRDEETEMFFRK